MASASFLDCAYHQFAEWAFHPLSSRDYLFGDWRVGGTSILLGVVYLHPSPLSWEANLQKLAKLADLTQGSDSRPFVLFGDFNLNPSELLYLGWPQKVQAMIMALQLMPHAFRAVAHSSTV